MINKPVGYITSTKDNFKRKTVLDIIPKNIRVYPIGRLDYNTSGLLVLTNDGDLTFKLTHPKFKIEKTYNVIINGCINSKNIRRLKNGVIIDNYKTKEAKVEVLEKDLINTKLKITIFEGKNRQVRKMVAAIGHKVISLERVSVANLNLGDLKNGSFRYLNLNEVEQLKALVDIKKD